MEKFTRRNILAASAAAGAGALLPRVSRAAGPIKLKVYSNQPVSETSTQYLWFRTFQANLREAVGDKIQLDFFPNAILAKETDAIQQVKLGVIDIMIQNSGVWSSLCPEIGVFDLCYLFDSEDHQAKAMDGNAGAVANKLLYDKTGVSTIAWTYHLSPRSLFTKEPVRSLAEVKDRKIRVFSTKVFVDGWQIMGTVPTPIPFSELYSALQTGVVDGFENDFGSVLSMKLNDLTKNCYLTQHLFMPMCTYVGKPAWNKIPADLHQPFLKAADATTATHRAECKQKAQVAMEELKRLGVAFAPMSQEERAHIRAEMAEKLWAPFGKAYPATKEIIDGVAAARQA